MTGTAVGIPTTGGPEGLGVALGSGVAVVAGTSDGVPPMIVAALLGIRGRGIRALLEGGAGFLVRLGCLDFE